MILNKKSALFIIVTILLMACTQTDKKFSVVQKLSEYKQTDFLATLESHLPKDKNAIYCVTLLFAWDEIRKKINKPFTINKANDELIELNNSNMHLNALKKDEYDVQAQIDGDKVTARAEFNKSLPFEFKLSSFKDELLFNKIKVSSFGTFGPGYESSKIIRILYYKNDQSFIIKLIPKNKEHEIILMMSDENFNSMSEMISDLKLKQEMGKKEKLSDKLIWKYFLVSEDEVIIPKFKFNIEHNYSNLEGSKFNTSEQLYFIEKAYQRTAFILDESGAEIESESEITTAATEALEEKPHPKKMRFNKPFFVLLKRTDAENPYFGMWVANTELMIKE